MKSSRRNVVVMFGLLLGAVLLTAVNRTEAKENRCGKCDLIHSVWGAKIKGPCPRIKPGDGGGGPFGTVGNYEGSHNPGVLQPSVNGKPLADGKAQSNGGGRRDVETPAEKRVRRGQSTRAKNAERRRQRQRRQERKKARLLAEIEMALDLEEFELADELLDELEDLQNSRMKGDGSVNISDPTYTLRRE